MAKNMTARAITRAEFSCLRGHLSGVDLRVLADRYLAPGLDLRVVKTLLRRITDDVRRVALRHGRFDAARLTTLRLPSPEADGSSMVRPTLDDYRLRHDPQYFYTERDLMALYTADYPDGIETRRGQRRARLRERQLTALAWAEAMVVSQPALADPVEAWLPAPFARRLRDAGYGTLDEVVAFMNERGARWYSEIAQFGAVGAAYVRQFVTDHVDDWGITVSTHALAPRRALHHEQLMATRAPATAIVPLESFLCPAALDGSRGRNRAPKERNLCDADDDLSALKLWLSRYASSPNTFRVYRREVERLLLWSILEARKPLSSWRLEDCVAYQRFLADPFKSSRWASAQRAERWSDRWRPFDAGALSSRSQISAIQVCSLWFAWCVDMQYLSGNPFRGVVRQQAGDESARQTQKQQALAAGPSQRTLSLALWHQVQDHLTSLPDDASTIRLRWVLGLGQGMGLRAREMVEARVSDLFTVTDPISGSIITYLGVLGKGNKLRRIPVPAHLFELLGAHLAARGLDPVAHHNAPETYLIGRLVNNAAPFAERQRGISYESVYKLVTHFFTRLSTDPAFSRDAQQTLQHASTHWLRHCFGSHYLAMGMRLESVQEALGHASIATTSQYAQTELADLNRAMVEAAAKLQVSQ